MLCIKLLFLWNTWKNFSVRNCPWIPRSYVVLVQWFFWEQFAVQICWLLAFSETLSVVRIWFVMLFVDLESSTLLEYCTGCNCVQICLASWRDTTAKSENLWRDVFRTWKLVTEIVIFSPASQAVATSGFHTPLQPFFPPSIFSLLWFKKHNHKDVLKSICVNGL